MTEEQCEQLVNLYETLTLSIRDLEGLRDHKQAVRDLKDVKESLKDLITNMIYDSM